MRCSLIFILVLMHVEDSENARKVPLGSLECDQQLQNIGDGLMPKPKRCFSKLHSLIVDQCQFLSDAVLPFDWKHCKFETVIMWKPNHIWCETCNTRLLQQEYVDNCNCHKSVFPESVAKDLVKLENLVIAEDNAIVAIYV